MQHYYAHVNYADYASSALLRIAVDIYICFLMTSNHITVAVRKNKCGIGQQILYSVFNCVRNYLMWHG
jgi:hypothetical protein